eukprot:c8984_g1_i1.p1 GENE.c8984_g1_i1~~c8984_g1_i1.p1  ORF type:complete len:177 (+),score=41.96 c8984_g1_i1:717-1247(+)
MNRGWCGIECVAHRSPAPYQDGSRNVQTLLPNNQIVFYMNDCTQRRLDWNMIRSPLQASFTIEADRGLVTPLLEYYIQELRRYRTLSYAEVWTGEGSFPPRDVPEDYIQMLEQSVAEYRDQQAQERQRQKQLEMLQSMQPKEPEQSEQPNQPEHSQQPKAVEGSERRKGWCRCFCC